MVCAAALCKFQALCSLAAMSWKRPNNGSRMNREVHVRFWESPEVKVLRATRRGKSWCHHHASPPERCASLMRRRFRPNEGRIAIALQWSAVGEIQRPKLETDHAQSCLYARKRRHAVDRPSGRHDGLDAFARHQLGQTEFTQARSDRQTAG